MIWKSLYTSYHLRLQTSVFCEIPSMQLLGYLVLVLIQPVKCKTRVLRFSAKLGSCVLFNHSRLTLSAPQQYFPQAILRIYLSRYLFHEKWWRIHLVVTGYIKSCRKPTKPSSGGSYQFQSPSYHEILFPDCIAPILPPDYIATFTRLRSKTIRNLIPLIRR